MSQKPSGDDDSEVKHDGSKSFSDEDLFIAMTDVALQDDARSASASTIQDEIVKTLHKIENERTSPESRSVRTQSLNKDEAATETVTKADSDNDVVVVMNVALKVEGMTKKEFHNLTPMERGKLVGHLIETNVSMNASSMFTSDGEGRNERQTDENEVVEATSDDANTNYHADPSGGASNDTQPEMVRGEPTDEQDNVQSVAKSQSDAAASTETNEEAGQELRPQFSDEGENKGGNLNVAPAPPETNARSQGSSSDAVTEGNPENSRASLQSASSGGPTSGSNSETERRESKSGVAARDESYSRSGTQGRSKKGYGSTAASTNAGPEDDDDDEDGEGDDDDGPEIDGPESSKAASLGISESVTSDPKKAAELVGSLIGMENAIQRDAHYDATQMAAFPPLWVSTGAKIRRQHEAESNWKDKMQNWETEKPERPTIYKIAIRDNLIKLSNKCYGCTDHGLHMHCLGYTEKVHEVPKYKYYADVPTPEEYPTFGKGLVPRKQAQDMQARKAKQRYQPFTYKDVYQKNQFVLSKSVPYYYKKQKPPRNQPHKLPPIGKQMAKDLQDDRAHHKNAPLGTNTRIDELARPHQYNTCKSYFPGEYITAFKDPKDQVCFKDVAMFLPKEETDKVNKTEDMWPKSAREKKKSRKREED